MSLVESELSCSPIGIVSSLTMKLTGTCWLNNAVTPFSEDRAIFYEEAWDKSVAQTRLMIDQITKLKPYDVKLTSYMGFNRNYLIELKPQIEQLQESIQEYNNKIEAEKKQLTILNKNRDKNRQRARAKEKQSKHEQIAIYVELAKTYPAELVCIQDFACACANYLIQHSNIVSERLELQNKF